MSKPTNELLRKFEPNLISKLRDAYASQEKFDDKANGVGLFHEPFTHCVLSDFLADSAFENDLYKEVKSKLKFAQKNNDLYKFRQTDDLSRVKSSNISCFRDKILYGSFLKLLNKITNIDLTPNKIDVTSSKYEFSDYLLCHDDDIHDVNKHGRRIAFIYYMVPEWSQDGSDGEDLQPTEIVKSLCPKSNTLLFFEVSDRSFHQVSEVFSQTKTRYSINGWFHGETNFRPAPKTSPLPEPILYSDIDANLFFEWIVEKYLKPTNQTEIQMKFTDSSEIKLDKIFHSHKYEQISESLTSKDIVWKAKGPANRRNYEVADMSTVPQIINELIQVLTCDYMGLTLSNMTGLGLHSSVPKSKIDLEDEDEFDDEDDEVDDDFEDEDDGDISDEEEDDFDSNDDQENESEKEEENEKESKSKSSNSHDSDSLKRKYNESNQDKNSESEEKHNIQPGTSSASMSQSENLYKRLKTSTQENNEVASSSSADKVQLGATSSQADVEYSKPKCYFEVRRWKQGAYTLITDDDSEIKTKALDLMVFFKCKQWSLDCGGNVSYIARDEDNELLTVNPEENCISLVYRDEETLKFTKCVNSRINQINTNKCFYEICVVYYE